MSILLVIARYLNVNELEENLLLCYPLTKRCTGEDIFNTIQDYFCENEIDWAKCCGVCTDGGKFMSGCYKGLRGRIKTVAPHVTWSHCCVHSQSLSAKPLPDPLKVLNQSAKVVNFIKANSTNTRLFKSLCGDTTLLLHTEVRWLSRGNVLARLFELRHEVLMFFEDHPFSLRFHFVSPPNKAFNINNVQNHYYIFGKSLECIVPILVYKEVFSTHQSNRTTAAPVQYTSPEDFCLTYGVIRIRLRSLANMVLESE
ncbi:Zinc finger BED domain-containing protein 5 [Araneus ventricosus]|uniref:Zinc finger BED domain-containing protein 5 n=1 Tax=Araneus ventricosus TaxID=182803 RepID=A0A4Y2BBY4_ARAVE|nr:Zinc finger BED domain-containing protein 5 [Araneus ventricosus]